MVFTLGFQQFTQFIQDRSRGQGTILLIRCPRDDVLRNVSYVAARFAISGLLTVARKLRSFHGPFQDPPRFGPLGPTPFRDDR